MLRSAVGSEEGDLSTGRDHEVVVLERSHLSELHPAAREVDPGHGSLLDGDVGLLVEEIPERVPDDGRFDRGGRQLVEEGLERVVVVLVDEHGRSCRSQGSVLSVTHLSRVCGTAQSVSSPARALTRVNWSGRSSGR